MKRMLLLIAAVSLLAACTNSNSNSNNANTNDQASAKDPAVATIAANEEEATLPMVDWDKPRYCIGVQGDTIAHWIYDEAGQLAQLYILGELFQDDYSGENTVKGCYCKFDDHGRLFAIVAGDDEHTYRYDFRYIDEEEMFDEDDASYTEEDVEMEYDDQGRVTDLKFRVNWSYFSDSRTYEGRVCHVDAYSSIPQMDELGMPYLENPTETNYQYTICY